MYRYDEFDNKLVENRVEEFEGQINRRISGDLNEEEFKPLRLMNGLYLQLHAYMLRVAIPYGELSSKQLLKLAEISEVFDRGYGHFTTRQNIQFNWPKLSDVSKILRELAKVEMHAIQTSGNCIRNISADHLAGLLNEEIEDPRPWCEIIRKWSTFHPEFSFLPRKFKIAVTGCLKDRAAILVHDIGIRIKKNNGITGFEIFVGGGQGRTPFIAKKICNFLQQDYLLNYLEAILKVYNQLGRRDNIYKARIKILVNELGIDKFKELVEKKFNENLDKIVKIRNSEIDKIKSYFALPKLDKSNSRIKNTNNRKFKEWLNFNTISHKVSGYKIILISLKSRYLPPGDMTAKQMRHLSKISDSFSFGELRVTHEQNLVLPHVKNESLFEVWKLLEKENLATPNIGLITDSICCPGMDYCALATARSIPISQKIYEHFNSLKKQKQIGKLKIKISGCINACGHHHVGNIGILGLDRNGEEFYQVTLGGSSTETSKIGRIVGASFSKNDIIPAIEKIIDVYIQLRDNNDQSFLETFEKHGIEPFKKALYGNT